MTTENAQHLPHSTVPIQNDTEDGVDGVMGTNSS